MANTTPVADTAGVVEQVARRGDSAGWCTVRPVGAVTVGLAGERLAELDAMANSRAQVRVARDDGTCGHGRVLMRRPLAYVKLRAGGVARHAAAPRRAEGARRRGGVAPAGLGRAGWRAGAEASITARDVLLAQHVGSRLH